VAHFKNHAQILIKERSPLKYTIPLY